MKKIILALVLCFVFACFYSCKKVLPAEQPTPNATQTIIAGIPTATCTLTATTTGTYAGTATVTETATDEDTVTVTATVTQTATEADTSTATITVTMTGTPVCAMEIGYNIGANQSWLGGWMAANKFSASSSASVNTLKMTGGSVCSGPVAGTCAIALYSDASGVPGTLLASASGLSYSSGVEVWAQISPVALASGSVYWLVSIASDCGLDGIAPGAGGLSDTAYINYGWGTFAGSGFPADASSLPWVISYATFQNNMSAENCAY